MTSNLYAKILPTKLSGSLRDGGWTLDFIVAGDTDAVYYAQNIILEAKSGAFSDDLEYREIFNGHLLNDPDAIDIGRAASQIQCQAATLDKFLTGERIQDIGFVSIAGATDHSKHQIQTMNFGEIVDHIIKYHCNVIYDASRMAEGIVTTVDIDTTNSTQISRFNVYESGNLWQAIQDIGGGEDGGEFYLAWFDRLNGFHYQPAPAFWTTPPTSKGTLTIDHLRDKIQVQVRNNNPRDRIGQVTLSAHADYGTTYNASYPAAPARGRIVTINNGVFAQSQARADTLAQRAYQWLTRSYSIVVNVDPGLVLFSEDGVGIDLGDKVQLSYDGTEDVGAGANLVFEQQSFFVYEIEITFDAYGKTGNCQLKLEYDPT